MAQSPNTSNSTGKTDQRAEGHADTNGRGCGQRAALEACLEETSARHKDVAEESNAQQHVSLTTEFAKKESSNAGDEEQSLQNSAALMADATPSLNQKDLSHPREYVASSLQLPTPPNCSTFHSLPENEIGIKEAASALISFRSTGDEIFKGHFPAIGPSPGSLAVASDGEHVSSSGALVKCCDSQSARSNVYIRSVVHDDSVHRYLTGALGFMVSFVPIADDIAPSLWFLERCQQCSRIRLRFARRRLHLLIEGTPHKRIVLIPEGETQPGHRMVRERELSPAKSPRLVLMGILYGEYEDQGLDVMQDMIDRPMDQT